jgi:hypothetical protein
MAIKEFICNPEHVKTAKLYRISGESTLDIDGLISRINTGTSHAAKIRSNISIPISDIILCCPLVVPTELITVGKYIIHTIIGYYPLEIIN